MKAKVKVSDLIFLQNLSKKEVKTIELVIETEYAYAMDKLNPLKRMFAFIRNGISLGIFLKDEYPWLLSETKLNEIKSLQKTALYFKCITSVRLYSRTGICGDVVTLNDEEISWFTYLFNIYLR